MALTITFMVAALVRADVERVELERDWLFAHPEEAADIDDHGLDLAGLVKMMSLTSPMLASSGAVDGGADQLARSDILRCATSR